MSSELLAGIQRQGGGQQQDDPWKDMIQKFLQGRGRGAPPLPGPAPRQQGPGLEGRPAQGMAPTYQQPKPTNVPAGPSIGTSRRGTPGGDDMPAPQAGQPGPGGSPYRPPPGRQAPAGGPETATGVGASSGRATATGGSFNPTGEPGQQQAGYDTSPLAAAPAGSGNANGSGGQHVPMGRGGRVGGLPAGSSLPGIGSWLAAPPRQLNPNGDGMPNPQGGQPGGDAPDARMGGLETASGVGAPGGFATATGGSFNPTGEPGQQQAGYDTGPFGPRGAAPDPSQTRGGGGRADFGDPRRGGGAGDPSRTRGNNPRTRPGGSFDPNGQFGYPRPRDFSGGSGSI